MWVGSRNMQILGITGDEKGRWQQAFCTPACRINAILLFKQAQLLEGIPRKEAGRPRFPALRVIVLPVEVPQRIEEG